MPDDGVCRFRCGTIAKVSDWPGGSREINIYDCAKCGRYGISGELLTLWDERFEAELLDMKADLMSLREMESAKGGRRIGVFGVDQSDSHVVLVFLDSNASDD